jgi:hypothetical protein
MGELQQSLSRVPQYIVGPARCDETVEAHWIRMLRRWKG